MKVLSIYKLNIYQAFKVTFQIQIQYEVFFKPNSRRFDIIFRLNLERTFLLRIS